MQMAAFHAKRLPEELSSPLVSIRVHTRTTLDAQHTGIESVRGHSRDGGKGNGMAKADSDERAL